MKGRVILLLTAIGAASLLTAGVALAATINCPNAPNGVCNGTSAPDTLTGTNNPDTMNGFGGDDAMRGALGNDVMYGGNETGYGDGIYGGGGNDQIYGQDGDDLIQGDAGQDLLNTGSGSDRVNAQDGFADTIICGSSTADLVYYDRGLDKLQNCGASTTLSVGETPEEGPPGELFTTHGKVLVENDDGKQKCVSQEKLEDSLKDDGAEILGVCKSKGVPGPEAPE